MIEPRERGMNVRDGERVHPIDDYRGTGGMIGFIATEFALFVVLFFSYFFLAAGNQRWASEQPPEMHLALIMLVLLLLSSAVLHWGERRLKSNGDYRRSAGRAALVATIAIGVGFMALQTIEYRNHLQHLTPWSNAYGSIFYAITSFHALHLLMGLCILLYVLALPRWEPAVNPPHRPYHNAALYWHFVDFVWIFIVGVLYVAPNL